MSETDCYTWREPLSNRVWAELRASDHGARLEVHAILYWADEADRVQKILDINRQFLSPEDPRP